MSLRRRSVAATIEANHAVLSVFGRLPILLVRSGQRSRNHCQKPTDGGSIWVVIRVGFDDGHADHSGVGSKSPKQRRDMVQLHAGPIGGDVG
jgi:hypothetical protein